VSPVHIAGAFATLIAPVPFAEAAVGLLRARHDAHARRGVPAHVTLLGPLVPSHADLERAAAAFAAVLARTPAPLVRFVKVGSLNGAMCLLPEDPAPLMALSRELQAVSPLGAAPGRPSHRVPHMTVARGGAYDRRQVERILDARLPLSGPVASPLLLVAKPDQPVQVAATLAWHDQAEQGADHGLCVTVHTMSRAAPSSA
jgi:hypothetical protein